MAPHELLGHGVFWHLAEGGEHRALLEVDVEAVSEADLGCSYQMSWIDSEWVLDCAIAFLEAGNACLSNLLAKLHGPESQVDLVSLGADVVLSEHFSCLFLVHCH